MGTDKLNVTARAAGFAMACDETAVPQPATSRQAVLALPAPKAQGAAQPSTALAPIKQAKERLSLGMLGWGFWKTA
jgi:hypothetical protein